MENPEITTSFHFSPSNRSLTDVTNSNLGDGTELKARGNWNDIKGQARQPWADLTADDLTDEEGKQDEWFGKLQEKTGHAVDDIESWFSKTF